MNYNTYTMSKKELIEAYKKGELHEIGSTHISNCAGIVLIEANEEFVFGYAQVMDSEKDFFKRKVEYTTTEESRAYFTVGTRYYLDEFMRINR
jgi:hypothetical protein